MAVPSPEADLSLIADVEPESEKFFVQISGAGVICPHWWSFAGQFRMEPLPFMSAKFFRFFTLFTLSHEVFPRQEPGKVGSGVSFCGFLTGPDLVY